MEENITSAENQGIFAKCKAGFQFCKEKIASSKSKIWHFALLFIAFFAIELLAYIMLLPSVGFCLDTGHLNLLSIDLRDYMPVLGKRIKALHIHDNDRRGDSHQIPFSMNIEWEPIAKALKDINYQGYLTLEADRYLSAYNSDNVFEGVCELAKSARRLEQMIKEA